MYLKPSGIRILIIQDYCQLQIKEYLQYLAKKNLLKIRNNHKQKVLTISQTLIVAGKPQMTVFLDSYLVFCQVTTNWLGVGTMQHTGYLGTVYPQKYINWKNPLDL